MNRVGSLTQGKNGGITGAQVLISRLSGNWLFGRIPVTGNPVSRTYPDSFRIAYQTGAIRKRLPTFCENGVETAYSGYPNETMRFK